MSRPRFSLALATTVAAASALSVVLIPGVAHAALDSHCAQQPNGQVVCTFSAPGRYALVTPTGFGSAEVHLQGGSGGPGGDFTDSNGTIAGGAGGAGGSTNGILTLPNANGPTLDIWVGGQGRSGNHDCGPNGGPKGGKSGPHVHGGAGGSVDGGLCGGSGGGGSFITAHGVKPNHADPMAAAGGGGGGGTRGIQGGDAGTPDGTAGGGSNGGGPGTQTAGGAGGHTSQTPSGDGQSGSRGNGGYGGSGGFVNCQLVPNGCLDTGGGGGGGFYGGGGGAAGGNGGGGGSGCLPCPQPAGFVTTSTPGQPGTTEPEPVFHEAAIGSVLLIFGDAGITGPPGHPNPPRDNPPGFASNDPNTNTNPERPEAQMTVLCEPNIGFCRLGPIVGPDSIFNITARGGSNPAVLFGTLQGGGKPQCPHYTPVNSDWLAFGFKDPVAGSSWHKVTTLKTRHAMSRPDATALSKKMQICFEATYRFATRPGYELGGHNRTFDGVLPDCAGGGDAQPCVSKRELVRAKSGWVVRLAFRVPANQQDPKALG